MKASQDGMSVPCNTWFGESASIQMQLVTLHFVPCLTWPSLKYTLQIQ